MGMFFFLLRIFFSLISTSKVTCPISSCNGSNLTVKFPFGIQTQQPENCTYPGFELSCTKQGIPSLNIADSGEFLVRHINYQTQEISVYDPNSCLAKRLLNFDPLKFTFMPVDYMELHFLTCPAKLALNSNYTVIECLSDSRNMTLATTRLDVEAEPKECEIIGPILIPTAMPMPHDNSMVAHVFKNDLLLTWNTPEPAQTKAKLNCQVKPDGQCQTDEECLSRCAGCWKGFGKVEARCQHVCKCSFIGQASCPKDVNKCAHPA